MQPLNLRSQTVACEFRLAPTFKTTALQRHRSASRQMLPIMFGYRAQLTSELTFTHHRLTRLGLDESAARLMSIMSS